MTVLSRLSDIAIWRKYVLNLSFRNRQKQKMVTTVCQYHHASQHCWRIGFSDPRSSFRSATSVSESIKSIPSVFRRKGSLDFANHMNCVSLFFSLQTWLAAFLKFLFKVTTDIRIDNINNRPETTPLKLSIRGTTGFVGDLITIRKGTLYSSAPSRENGDDFITNTKRVTKRQHNKHNKHVHRQVCKGHNPVMSRTACLFHHHS